MYISCCEPVRSHGLRFIIRVCDDSKAYLGTIYSAVFVTCLHSPPVLADREGRACGGVLFDDIYHQICVILEGLSVFSDNSDHGISLGFFGRCCNRAILYEVKSVFDLRCAFADLACALYWVSVLMFIAPFVSNVAQWEYI